MEKMIAVLNGENVDVSRYVGLLQGWTCLKRKNMVLR